MRRFIGQWGPFQVFTDPNLKPHEIRIEKVQMDSFERRIAELKKLLDEQHVTPSREKSLVHTKLDEALMWYQADVDTRYGKQG